MTATLYHGGDLPEIQPGLCLAEDPETASEYIVRTGRDGQVHTFTLSAPIASEDDLLGIAADLGHHGYGYELADRDDVRSALLDAGVQAVRYTDYLPESEIEHDTVLVLDPSTLTRI